MATKGVSSMLSSTLLGAFTTPVTYVLISILLGTAIMQVRYVNKALQRFDSTQVIPIQFVSFTLCVIIGSAVLYRDFESTTTKRAFKFIGGCLLTFFGVFLITSGRPSVDEDEETLSDDEDIVDTIRLPEQDPNTPQSPDQHRHRDNNISRSRRSSKVSFMDAINKPLAVLAETGVPTARSPGNAALRASQPSSGETGESAPLLRTPSGEPSVHPGIQHALSSDSAVTISSATPIVSEPTTHPGTPSNQTPPLLNIPQDMSPMAARTPASASRPRSHHFNGPLFSPSPLDSTVRGLVPSTLLTDSPSARRPPSRRRLSKPGIRSSLFVSQDDLVQDLEDEEIGIMSAIERSRTADTSFNGNSPIDGQKRNGLRNRARSLTHTMGDLFGVGKKRVEGINGDENGGPAQSQSQSQLQTDHSTETS